MSLLVYKSFFVSDLLSFEGNSRTHSDEQVAQIVSSIEEFGFTNPLLVDEEGVIIAGHGRLAAAKILGMVEIPCLVLSGLSDAQKAAYVIADNRLALSAGWDEEKLVAAFDFLREQEFDLELTGFSHDEISSFSLDEEIIELCDEDDAPAIAENIVTKRGDVWILGEHRLMCGDSTSLDDVSKLMAGEQADMVFTDPPYNVAFSGRTKKFDVIKNDDLEAQEFVDFIGAVCSTITSIQAPYYIWCNWKFYGLLQNLLPFTACIVWAKNNFGLGNGYRHQHEFCLTNAQLDKKVKNESDLWQVAKDSTYLHPTQKPVALAERALGNHSKAKNVLDLFGGSGSTLIACEKLKRKCFMMELDPKYCDVIINRYKNYTGKEPFLEVSNA